MNIYETFGNVFINIKNEDKYEEFDLDIVWDGTYENMEYETEKEVIEYIEHHVKDLLESNSWNLFTDWVEVEGYDSEKHGKAQIKVDISSLNIDLIDTIEDTDQ